MSVGRPREFDLETVLESAMCAFWRRVYEATSLQDLLSVMKLSKSSFYQIFESKKSLFQRCVNYYHDDLCNRMKFFVERSKWTSPILEVVVKGKEDGGAAGKFPYLAPKAGWTCVYEDHPGRILLNGSSNYRA